MGGIEDIEKPFQPIFARLSVIEQEQRQGKKAQGLRGPQSGIGIVDAQSDEPEGEGGQTMGFFLKGAHPHRQQDPEESVIHRHVTAQKSHTHHRRSEGDKPHDAVLARRKSRFRSAPFSKSCCTKS